MICSSGDDFAALTTTRSPPEPKTNPTDRCQRSVSGHSSVHPTQWVGFGLGRKPTQPDPWTPLTVVPINDIVVDNSLKKKKNLSFWIQVTGDKKRMMKKENEDEEEEEKVCAFHFILCEFIDLVSFWIANAKLGLR